MPSAPRPYVTSEVVSAVPGVDSRHFSGFTESIGRNEHGLTFSREELLCWCTLADAGLDDDDPALALQADWAELEGKAVGPVASFPYSTQVTLILLLEAAGGKLKLKALSSAASALGLGLRQDEIRRLVLQEPTSFKFISAKGNKCTNIGGESVVSLRTAEESVSAMDVPLPDNSTSDSADVPPREVAGAAHAAQLASMLEQGGRFAISDSQATCADPPLQPPFNATSSSETLSNALAFSSHCYGHQALTGQSCLSNRAAASDSASLLAAFDAFITEHGFLTSSFVRAQLDMACKVRKVNQWKILKDPHVGELFLGVTKMLFFVDTTLHVAFATCPLVTFHDLESALLRSEHFQGKNSFKEAGLGDLRYHPEVESRMQLRPSDGPSDSFPKLTAAQLLTMMMLSWENEGNRRPGQWTAEQGLAAAAKQLGLDDYRQLGVYMQRDRLLEFVFFKIHPRREGVRKTCDALVRRAMRNIHAEYLSSCDWNQWSEIFGHIKSLDSLPRQFYFVQRLLFEAIGGSHLRNSAAESAPLQVEQFVQAVLAPLFLLSLAAAHITWQPHGEQKDQPRELAQALAALQQLLPLNSPGLELIVQELQEPDDPDAGLEKVLLRAEEALVQLCRVEHPGQLPLSLAELIAARPEFSQALARRFQSTKSRWDASGTSEATYEESSVLDHVLQLLQGERAPGHPDQASCSFVELIRALGHSEAELCKARGVEAFTDLGFDGGFGFFMARHAGAIVEAAGPAGLASSSLLGRSLSNFCKTLLQARVEEASAIHRAATAHFGTTVSDEEIMQAIKAAKEESIPSPDSKMEMGMSMQVLVAQGNIQVQVPIGRPVELPEAAARRAVERILNVPPLLDISEGLAEWLEEFEPSLGPLGTFLRSALYAEVFSDVSAVQKGRIVEVRRDCFIRVLDGNTDEFAQVMAARDARAAAAGVLGRWLRDGEAFPMEQFEEIIERHFSLWAEGVCHLFLLTAVAALPREFRKDTSTVFVRPYLQRSFPKGNLARVAQTSSELTLAARWIGRNFGEIDWDKLPWAENYPVACVEEFQEGTKHVGAGEVEALRQPIPQQPVDQAVPVVNRSGRWKSRVGVTKAPHNDNEALCWDIARLKAVNFVDVDSITREWLRLPEDEAKRALQQTVQGAVRRLAADLYSADTHYLLELLQNVDDCEFPDGTRPALKITLETDPVLFAEYTTFKMQASKVSALLVLEHNEVGFMAQNVRALCDIANSTKTAGTRKFIGAKGIGFKSVFTATPTPVVHSRGAQSDFHFHFDAAALDGLGYIIPFPLECPSTFQSPHGTRLVLPLQGTRKANEVCARLCEDLQPHLLLFLRKLQGIVVLDTTLKTQRTIWKEHGDQLVHLRTVVISIDNSEARKEADSASTEKASEEKTLTSGPTKVRKIDNVSETWYVYRLSVELPGTQQQTELQLAFRLSGEVGQILQQQPTFAWLPLRSYGFRFILQADWVVPSSREAIVANHPLNQRLRDELPKAFKNAAANMTKFAWKQAAQAARVTGSEGLVDRLPEQPQVVDVASEGLHKFYQVVPLPGETSDFFSPTPQAILQELSKVKCLLVRRLLTQDEKSSHEIQLELPEHAVRADLPRHVALPSADVRILEPLLNASGRYIEVGGIPPTLADFLAVPPVDSAVALGCLRQMSQQNSTANEHSSSQLEMTHLLLGILAFDVSPPLPQLKPLAIIPTADGQFCSLAKEDVYDVNSDLAVSLKGVARALDSRFKNMMHAKVTLLVRRLGVQQTDGVQFLLKVLIPALTQASCPPKPNLIALLCAARRCLATLPIDKQDTLLVQMRGKAWIYVHDPIKHKSEPVRVCESTVLHASHLPALLQEVWQAPWIVPSEEYASDDVKSSGATVSGSDAAACAMTWDQFWLKLGAWPAVAIESVLDETGAPNHFSSEMSRIMSALNEEKSLVKQRHMAVQLIEWLAPHGEVYTPFLSRPKSDENEQMPSEFNLLLHRNAWIPTMDDVRMPSSGWLADPPLHGLMSQFCFHPCVKQLLQKWQGLELSQQPTVTALTATLKDLSRRPQPRFRLADLQNLYESLARACETERLSVLLANLDESSDSPQVQELLTFLRKARWVFVPNHAVLDENNKRRTSANEVCAGTFCAPRDLVFKDPIELLDGFASKCTDMMRDIAWEGTRVRVVGEYYYGQFSRPWRYRWQGESKIVAHPSRGETRLHALLRQCGVTEEATWKHYLEILREVDRRTNNDTQDNHADMRKIVERIMTHLAKEVEKYWSQEEADDARADEDPDAPREEDADTHVNYSDQADNDEGSLWPAASSSEAVDAQVPPATELNKMAQAAHKRISDDCRHCNVLVNFVVHAAGLRCVSTQAGTWEVFSKVFFIQDESSHEWLEEARRFVVCAPTSRFWQRFHAETKRAWEYCGLKAASSETIKRFSCNFPRREFETEFARAALLAGIRCLTKGLPSRSKPAFQKLWEVGCAFDFHFVASIQVQVVAIMEDEIATLCEVLPVLEPDADLIAYTYKGGTSDHVHPSCLPEDATRYAVIANVYEAEETAGMVGFLGLNHGAPPVCASKGFAKSDLCQYDRAERIVNLLVEIAEAYSWDAEYTKAERKFFKDVKSSLPEYIQKIADKLDIQRGIPVLHSVDRACSIAKVPEHTKLGRTLDLHGALMTEPEDAWKSFMSKHASSESEESNAEHVTDMADINIEDVEQPQQQDGDEQLAADAQQRPEEVEASEAGMPVSSSPEAALPTFLASSCLEDTVKAAAAKAKLRSDQRVNKFAPFAPQGAYKASTNIVHPGTTAWQGSADGQTQQEWQGGQTSQCWQETTACQGSADRQTQQEWQGGQTSTGWQATTAWQGSADRQTQQEWQSGQTARGRQDGISYQNWQSDPGRHDGQSSRGWQDGQKDRGRQDGHTYQGWQGGQSHQGRQVGQIWQDWHDGQGRRARSVPPKCNAPDPAGEDRADVASHFQLRQTARSTPSTLARVSVRAGRASSLPPRPSTLFGHTQSAAPAFTAPTMHSNQRSQEHAPSLTRAPTTQTVAPAKRFQQVDQRRSPQGGHSFSLPPLPFRSEATRKHWNARRAALGLPPSSERSFQSAFERSAPANGDDRWAAGEDPWSRGRHSVNLRSTPMAANEISTPATGDDPWAAGEDPWSRGSNSVNLRSAPTAANEISTPATGDDPWAAGADPWSRGRDPGNLLSAQTEPSAPATRGCANRASVVPQTTKSQLQPDDSRHHHRQACSQPACTRRAFHDRFAEILGPEQHDIDNNDNAHDGGRPPPGSVGYATAKIQEKLVRAALDPGMGDLRGPVSVTSVLWRIFYENGGMAALNSDLPHRDIVFDVKTVSEIRYSHDTIKSSFTNGDHKGAGVRCLVQDLSTGKVDPMKDDRLRLNVVRYHGNLVSLNNRRLYALKEHQKVSFPRVIRVRVRILPLDATTVKFVLSYSTNNAGIDVELR